MIILINPRSPTQTSHICDIYVKPFNAFMVDYLVVRIGKYYNICGFSLCCRMPGEGNLVLPDCDQ
jgi:hypothetical protein